MISKNENLVLMNFLKSGMSTRELDKKLGHSSVKTKGWKSWKILKNYGLRNSDKGKLYTYSQRQAQQIINQLGVSNMSIDNIVKSNPPTNLEKYRDTFVIAKNEKKFYEIFSGETRNIIQSFFNPKKKIIGRCQFTRCKSKGQIDTVHLAIDRPSLFMSCAIKNSKPISGNLLRFDVYETMKSFLNIHSRKGSICFLCKKHHNELHTLEKKDRKSVLNFRKKIEII